MSSPRRLPTRPSTRTQRPSGSPSTPMSKTTSCALQSATTASAAPISRTAPAWSASRTVSKPSAAESSSTARRAPAPHCAQSSRSLPRKTTTITPAEVCHRRPWMPWTMSKEGIHRLRSPLGPLTGEPAARSAPRQEGDRGPVGFWPRGPRLRPRQVNRWHRMFRPSGAPGCCPAPGWSTDAPSDRITASAHAITGRLQLNGAHNASR